MSDEEYEYDYDDAEDEKMEDRHNNETDYDDDDQSFDYTDDDEEADDANVDLENAYYNAKGIRDTGDLTRAMTCFEGVLTKESYTLSVSVAATKGDDIKHYGPWSYKALKQLVKLSLRFQDGQVSMTYYIRLLECISSDTCDGVTPNAVEKGVNGILERVSLLVQAVTFDQCSSSGSTSDTACPLSDSPYDARILARNVYDKTLKLFHHTGLCPNERLWFKTNLKYGHLLYEMHETAKLQCVLHDLLYISTQHDVHDLHAPDGSVGGTSGNSSSTNLMEVYALQIQLYSRLGDNQKLRDIFSRANRVRGGIPHPRTLALVQELGGKMHMASREFDSAIEAFFQAFRCYDEAGDSARLRCLKYLVMASMLHSSSINPFDSQEARAHRDDPEIVAMTRLVRAFHDGDVRAFESILRKNEGRIMDDEFARERIEELLRTMRTRVLQRLVRPYTRMSLAAIARDLNNVSIDVVEGLLVELILDGKLEGQINKVKGWLVKGVDVKYYGKSIGYSGATNNDSADGPGTNGKVWSDGACLRKGGGGRASSMVSTRPHSAIMGDGEGFVGSLYTAGTNSLEYYNCDSMERLAMALDNLTTTISSIGGGRSEFVQIM